MRWWSCGAVVATSFEQPDYPVTVPEGYRADVHGHPPAGNRDEVACRLHGRRGTEHLLGEQLTSAATVLGRDDRGEVTTANIAEKLLGCRIDPSDNACLVEDVARDAAVLQSLLDVPADT
jgi:hypothetical protein